MTSNRLRDLDTDYCDDRGVYTLWSSYTSEGKGYSEISRQFHPLMWGFGVEVQRTIAGYSDPHMLSISVTVGPCSLGYRREWPGDRDEYLAWQKHRDELEESR